MKRFLLILLIAPLLLPAQEIVLEEINLDNENIALSGTLTYPKSEKQLPLVIFIHGSGNVDRNGNQAGTPIQVGYLKTLADSLNAEGIAFYRYDKRTATPSNFGKLENTTISDFVDDAKIAIENFKDDKRFSGIHIIGHSQGSLIGMLAITDVVKSYISLAGPSSAIDKIIVTQIEKQSPELAKVASEHFKELSQTDTILKINPMLATVFVPKNYKFIKHWMQFDPSEEIKKISIPTLIINGEADLQVTVDEAKNLKLAQSDALIEIVPKMNHVLKEVNSVTENQSAYNDPKFPLSQILVERIKNFIITKK